MYIHLIVQHHEVSAVCISILEMKNLTDTLGKLPDFTLSGR